MLQVKSFPITDDTGISSLLREFPLASGAHILVSDGNVCVPFEDGKPEPNTLRIARIEEQKNTIGKELAIIEHSQKVMERLAADKRDQANAAEMKHKAATSDKDLEKKFKEQKAQLDNFENQMLMNKAEVVRLKINLECFDEQIGALQG